MPAKRRKNNKAKADGGKKVLASGPSVREHILDRTIYLMGKLGTTDVPVRAIAQEAGMNVAAINYYFSSKEHMLTLMADRFMQGFKDVMRLLESRDLPPEERLRRWATEVMNHLSEYPGILPLMERQLAADSLDAFGEALRSSMQHAARLLKATMREIIGGADEQRLDFKLTLFISTLAGPYPRRLVRGSEQRDRQAPAQRAQFLDLLIEHLKQ